MQLEGGRLWNYWDDFSSIGLSGFNHLVHFIRSSLSRWQDQAGIRLRILSELLPRHQAFIYCFNSEALTRYGPHRCSHSLSCSILWLYFLQTNLIDSLFRRQDGETLRSPSHRYVPRLSFSTQLIRIQWPLSRSPHLSKSEHSLASALLASAPPQELQHQSSTPQASQPVWPKQWKPVSVAFPLPPAMEAIKLPSDLGLRVLELSSSMLLHVGGWSRQSGR